MLTMSNNESVVQVGLKYLISILGCRIESNRFHISRSFSSPISKEESSSPSSPVITSP